ncbi:hypothetical protein RYZ20_10035 [Thioclava sp. A2]|nr:hypothetical protein [Thioclava sp. A2]MDV7271240.1 hypothetical protein [Thioclava sp. A2]
MYGDEGNDTLCGSGFYASETGIISPQYDGGLNLLDGESGDDLLIGVDGSTLVSGVGADTFEVVAEANYLPDQEPLLPPNITISDLQIATDTGAADLDQVDVQAYDSDLQDRVSVSPEYDAEGNLTNFSLTENEDGTGAYLFYNGQPVVHIEGLLPAKLEADTSWLGAPAGA